MSAADELVAHNVGYAKTYPGPRPVVPARHLTVVTCMDSRMDVHAMLGLELGEAHVIRNAGGIVTDDVVRSLAISQRRLRTEAVVVIHHTDCGLLNLDEDAFAAELAADAGSAPSWRSGTFCDVYEDVRKCVAQLQASPYLKTTSDIRGFVFDVDSGLLQEV
ncbi:MAG TPA: carbonic anhydrase [Mycobacteriales bacterium]|nr:carbonic anhydrase [Mycobacteriales bacterium]HWA67696.1 carbonic anhydrase [Mycobacteriales bacterium]